MGWVLVLGSGVWSLRTGADVNAAYCRVLLKVERPVGWLFSCVLFRKSRFGIVLSLSGEYHSWRGSAALG